MAGLSRCGHIMAAVPQKETSSPDAGNTIGKEDLKNKGAAAVQEASTQPGRTGGKKKKGKR